MSSINILPIRQRLGRKQWSVPEKFGPDGWMMERYDDGARIIITRSEMDGIPGADGEWVHASISRRDLIPSYWDLTALHQAVWPDGYAYQVFAPPGQHINIHNHALHLWGRPDGSALLPEFGAMGTI
ncbi:hypothetical protein SEA_ODYSSEY395_66 [Arthrobacter phage Odyssey395]|nr:hypothetical protein SEA_ODYSSEY395_66 [Arthrobacter phage Odyssey395]